MTTPNALKTSCPRCEHGTFVRSSVGESFRCSRCGLDLETARAIHRYGDPRHAMPPANPRQRPL